KSAIQGSNVPNPDEAVPSFVSGAMAKAGKGLLEGTLQAGTSAVSDKLLDLVGLGGKSAADKGKDTRDYLAAAFVRFPPTATKEIQYLNAKGALTYTDIAGDPVLYGNLPPREISMKDVFRSGDSSKKFKIAEGQ